MNYGFAVLDHKVELHVELATNQLQRQEKLEIFFYIFVLSNWMSRLTREINDFLFDYVDWRLNNRKVGCMCKTFWVQKLSE